VTMAMSKPVQRSVFLPLSVCLIASLAFAEHTRRWRQSTYEEFLKGTARGVAVRSDGHLELAPKFTLIADADASYLWSLRTDAGGVLYAAGGSPAKVFRFAGAGKPKTVFESTDLLAQAIAFDAKGGLYVATTPDGKVYRVASSGEKSVFFETKTKYIWDLAFAPDGTLFVATGDKGQIFAVAPEGKGELFYASDEAHIKTLGFDAKGNLLAGTEPNGRVLRLTRNAEKSAKRKSPDDSVADGFVIYETTKREVTSLTVAPDGTMYVAAIGEKTRTVGAVPSAVIATAQGTTTITNPGSAGPTQGTPFVAFPQTISSGIYRISAEGVPEEIWSSREDVVYALGLNADGRLLAGTGNTGSLLVIDGHGVYAQLAKSGSSQITGISKDANGKVFLCTANPGKVFSLGPEYEAEGIFESQSFDAKLFSQWGRIEWWGPPATGPQAKGARESKEPRLEFYIRSGNTEDPGREWSKWYGPYNTTAAQVEAPAARFFQWKAVIHDGRPGDGIDWVSVAYLPRNVAPTIDGIAMQDAGVRAQLAQVISGQPTNVTLKQPQTPNPSGMVITTSSSSPKFDVQPQGTLQKGYQTVSWTAHDENDDELRYSVYFRAENTSEWLLLKDNLDQRFYSWDTTTMPDGAYYLKIVASDAPSNPPAMALKSERESERFEVDNTPPKIEKLEASPSDMNVDRSKGVTYEVRFSAEDPSSSIERAQYSVDGGEWVLLAPTHGISDSRAQSYAFTTRGLSPGEHTIAVRAYDRFDNVGAGKTTIHFSGK
jgi:WD40 repeat protein